MLTGFAVHTSLCIKQKVRNHSHKTIQNDWQVHTRILYTNMLNKYCLYCSGKQPVRQTELVSCQESKSTFQKCCFFVAEEFILFSSCLIIFVFIGRITKIT